jgi:hypothetical protein
MDPADRGADDPIDNNADAGALFVAIENERAEAGSEFRLMSFLARYVQLLALCRSLAENDPEIAIADPRRPLRDFEASMLGQALLRNTRVVALFLDVGLLTEQGNYESLLEYLSNSQSLERVNLLIDEGASPVVADRFMSAISRSRTVRVLIVKGGGEFYVESLSQVLRNTTCLGKLSTTGCTLLSSASADAIPAQLTAAFSQNTTVTQYELSWTDPATFGAFLDALKVNSTMESFFLEGALGGTDRIASLGEASCKLLAQALPDIKHLKNFSVFLNNDAAGMARFLMDGLKRNSSLVGCNIEASFWGKHQKAMDFYLKRNEKIPLMIASPASVPVGLLPKVSGAALECTRGPDWVFRLLLAKQGDETIGEPRRKKRRLE